jgi:[protein-PII] uridylyltransferase
VRPATTRSERDALVADRTLTGAAWCAAHSALVDGWLAGLLASVRPDTRGIALVAVGGYGRAELCPESDIDLLLLHDRRVDGPAIAPDIWYPIWDDGWHLGHKVCTIRQGLGLAEADLDTATSLLSARHVAGDASLTEELATKAKAQWRSGARRWLEVLRRRVDERHQGAGEVAFQLEPDLKDGRGGMRDVQAIHWAEAAGRVLFENDGDALGRGYAVLLDARVELHRATRRPQNVLTQQDQQVIAGALGDPSVDALMHRIADAGRAIAWMSDDTWRRTAATLDAPRRRVGTARPLGGGVMLRDDEIHVDTAAWGADDAALLPLRVGAASATHDAPIDRATLDRLGGVPAMPEPWPAAARELLHELLLAGRPTVAVVEALDQRGAWQLVLPEWTDVRAKPQHNPYHRFTVDRHLLEATANAAALAQTVDRPDLLAMGALLHDIGKGRPGDHTEVGIAMVAVIGERLGYPPADVDVLRAMVTHHLLLPDVATRRDLSDPETIERVATEVGSVELLRLLAALTEADSIATGPSAWGGWKAQLVAELVERVESRLLGGSAAVAASRPWPTDAEIAELTAGGRRIEASGSTVTVATDDHPGVFSRVAGVLALRGLDVLEASAHSTDDGWALARFRVVDPVRDETPWDAITADLDRALDGRLALRARLAERAETRIVRTRPAARSGPVDVIFDNAASAAATVIDVEAPDALGILYRITCALSELDLDIRAAKVQTLGTRVVDAFYVRDRNGGKLLERDRLDEIARAIRYGVSEALGRPPA